MRTRPARVVAAASALAMLTAAVVTMTSCSSPSRAKDITGIWAFELKPLFDYDEEAHKAAIGQKTSKYDVSLYQRGDAVVGFCGPFHFQGSMSGDRLSLDVLQAGGAKEVANEANLELRLAGDGTISGKSMDSDLGHEHRGLGLSEVSATRVRDAPPLASLGSPAWYEEVLKVINGNKPWRWFKRMSNFVKFGYMDVDVPVKNGGGYYMMGDHGPGDEDYAGWTCYYPLDWGAHGAREYKFAIRYAGRRTSIDTLVRYIRGATPMSEAMGYKGDADGLVADIKDFHQRYGDFALTVAGSDETFNSGVYVSVNKGSDAKKAASHRLVKKLRGNLQTDHDGKTTHPFIKSGHDIKDSWKLWRPSVILDGKGLHFLYMLGTADVHYD